MEIYKVIDGYENYEVSNLGNVRNRLTGRVLSPRIISKGYNQVVLYKDGKPNPFLVHRLVANTYIPNPDNKSDVNHINGIKTDNCVETLEWNTRRENNIHAIITGLKKQCGLPKQKVRCVETKQEFESMNDAARHFGCFHSLIRQSILRGCRCKQFHFELV